jgi:hypothetical protein
MSFGKPFAKPLNVPSSSGPESTTTTWKLASSSSSFICFQASNRTCSTSDDLAYVTIVSPSLIFSVANEQMTSPASSIRSFR